MQKYCPFSHQKMIGVRYFRKTLEAFAMIDYKKSEPAWKHKSQIIHVYLFNTLTGIFAFAHLLSTVTRSIRYIPELCQVLFEDALILTNFFIRLLFRQQREQLKFLIDYMENSFSTADKGIIRKCHQKQYITYVIIFSILFTGILSDFLEVLLPISEEEHEIRQKVYRTEHPERRLPFNVKFPFIDETADSNYVPLYAVEVLIALNFIITSAVCNTVVLTIVIHLCGQYKILASYVEKIGTQHRNSHGNLIFYTNIRNNEYITLVQNKNMTSKAGVKFSSMLYEKDYLGQIIKFHQEIVEFKKKVIQEALV